MSEFTNTKSVNSKDQPYLLTLKGKNLTYVNVYLFLSFLLGFLLILYYFDPSCYFSVSTIRFFRKCLYLLYVLGLISSSYLDLVLCN